MDYSKITVWDVLFWGAVLGVLHYLGILKKAFFWFLSLPPTTLVLAVLGLGALSWMLHQRVLRTLVWYGAAMGLVYFFFSGILPHDDPAATLRKCRDYTAARYKVTHLKSQRAIYVFVHPKSSKLCLATDSKLKLALSWYSATRQNEADFSDVAEIERYQNSRNAVMRSGSQGTLNVISFSTFPVLYWDLPASQSAENRISLKTGQVYTGSAVIRRF